MSTKEATEISENDLFASGVYRKGSENTSQGLFGNETKNPAQQEKITAVSSLGSSRIFETRKDVDYPLSFKYSHESKTNDHYQEGKLSSQTHQKLKALNGNVVEYNQHSAICEIQVSQDKTVTITLPLALMPSQLQTGLPISVKVDQSGQYKKPVITKRNLDSSHADKVIEGLNEALSKI